MLYKVVSADSTELLAQLVIDHLHQGWTLVGGIAFDGNHYLQALTKS